MNRQGSLGAFFPPVITSPVELRKVYSTACSFLLLECGMCLDCQAISSVGVCLHCALDPCFAGSRYTVWPSAAYFSEVSYNRAGLWRSRGVALSGFTSHSLCFGDDIRLCGSGS